MAEILKYLIAEKMVVAHGDKFAFNDQYSGIHLSDKSPFIRMHHNNLRNLVLSKSWTDSEDVHYSSIFAVSKADIPMLRRQIVQLIQDQRESVASSGSESLSMFVCDFMKI